MPWWGWTLSGAAFVLCLLIVAAKFSLFYHANWPDRMFGCSQHEQTASGECP